MKSTLTVTFAFAVCLILSSLIYVSDPDVNGLPGLNSLGAVLFICAFSTVPFAFILIILVAAKRFGKKVGVGALLLSACAFSYLIMTISHSSLSLSHQIEIMAKSSAFMIGVFALAALPHWFMIIRKR